MHLISRIFMIAALLFALLIILASLASSQYFYYECEINECRSIDSCDCTNVVIIYTQLMADTVPSCYASEQPPYCDGLSRVLDSNIVKTLCKSKKWDESIVDILNKKKTSNNGSRGRNAYHDYGTSNLGLQNIYYFSDTPDFYLFGFSLTEPYTFGEPGNLLVGYLPATEELIVIDNEERSIIEADFNHFLENSSSLMNLSPECKSALLLRMIYEPNEIYILDSFQDLKPAMEISAYQGHYENVNRKKASCDRMLYYTNLKQFRALHSGSYGYESALDDHYQRLKNDGFSDSLNFNPPQILIDENNSMRVTLTIYVPNYGELADWKISFDEGGNLLTTKYARRPIFLNHFVPHNSPYSKWGNNN